MRRTKKQLEEGYGPEKDFYKRIRGAIVAMHRTGAAFSTVSGLLPTLTDQNKIKVYPDLVSGYKKWTARRNATWFEPPSGSCWSSGELTVAVNPELGLTIKGTPHLIKLYFKADPLTKPRVDIITHLMAITCAPLSPPATVMGVLDVRRSRLIKPTVPIPSLDTRLLAEAAYWVAAWNNM